MKVRILSTPKNTPKPQQVNAFTNPYAEQTPEMEYGGNLYAGEKPLGSNATIDTKWSYMKKDDKNFMQRNPFSSVGHILPEAPEGTADVEAEKQEKVMGDFVGDGMPVLMNVGGKPHSEGGKKLSLPANSFIFSDTPSLKLRDPQVLAQFGGGKKPMTPAMLATKYDLQKYKALIDNDQTPELEKNTAKLNYANAVKKLNDLASIQESMKAARGITPSTLPGQPQDQGQDDGTMMSKFGGRTLRTAQHGINTDDPLTPDDPTQWGTGPESVQPLYNPKDPESIRAFQKLMTEQHPDIVANSMAQINPKNGQPYGPPNSGDYIDGLDGPRTQYWENQLKQPQDNRMTVDGGQSAFSPIQQMPWSATAQDANQQAAQQPGDDTIGQGIPERQYPYIAPGGDSWMKKKLRQLAANSGSDPNAMGKFYNNLNALTYPHTMVKKENAVPFYQQPNYIDNRADIQRLQSIASGLGQNQGSNGPIARANLQGFQGNIADQVNAATQREQEHNAGEASRVGAANADMAFRTQGMNIENMKDYIANQNNAQKDYWSMLAGRNKNEVNLDNATKTQQRNFAWMNMSNPYYSLDANGMPKNQTKAQQQALQNIYQGKNAQGQTLEDEINAIHAMAKKNGWSDATEQLALKHATGERERIMKDAMGRTKSISDSGYIDNNNKYGGKTMEFGGKQLMKPKKQKMRVMECPA